MIEHFRQSHHGFPNRRPAPRGCVMNAVPCPATVVVRGRGTFTCEKEAGHEGPHEAKMETGEWKAVIWTDGTTSTAEPDV